MEKMGKMSRGIWKSPEQKEEVVDWTRPGLSSRDGGQWGGGYSKRGNSKE